MAEKPAVPACESDAAATAGHPTPQTTAEPPAPNPTYADKPAEDGTEAREAKAEGPGHAT